MSDLWHLVFALLALASGFVGFLVSAGAKTELARREPALAKELFSSQGEQFAFGYPVRFLVLFRQGSCTSVQHTLRLLRAIWLTHLVSCLGFSAAILFQVVRGAA